MGLGPSVTSATWSAAGHAVPDTRWRMSGSPNQPLRSRAILHADGTTGSEEVGMSRHCVPPGRKNLRARGRRPGSIGSPAMDDRGYGLGQNLEIEPRGPVVDVVHIHLHPLLTGQDLGTSAVNLPETGDARFDAEPAPMPVLTEPGVIPQRRRPGSHQTHEGGGIGLFVGLGPEAQGGYGLGRGAELCRIDPETGLAPVFIRRLKLYLLRLPGRLRGCATRD